MKKLRIHYFQHVEFEGLGSIEQWIDQGGHALNVTRFFRGDRLPELSELDMLIIMGGSMGVNNEQDYPWLAGEKEFIRQAISMGKIVLGICLGSQLVAAALGAEVYKNKYREIGWLDLNFTEPALSGKLFHDFNSPLKVFQWHGDTFDLPVNATHLAWSEACRNQAFLYGNKVLALQFHLEPTAESMQQMIESGRDELKADRYVQTEEQILENSKLLGESRDMLFKLLNRLVGQ